MGCYTYTCSVSGLPIQWRDRVIYLGLTRGEGMRGIGTQHAWMPATLPLRARYNDYGSIERWERGAVGKAFFASLLRRAIPRPVGENFVHDVAITADMSPEQWLHAMLEERVQVQHRNFGVTTVVQAMVRREVWDHLVESVQARTEKLPSFTLRDGLSFGTLLDRVDRGSDEAGVQRRMRELLSVNVALSRLGRPWARGSSSGPQSPMWQAQLAFQKVLMASVEGYLVRHEREYGEAFDDEDDGSR